MLLPSPVMSSGWVTDALPLGVLILIGVPEANAVVLNPGALAVVELAVVFVLDELAVLLDLLLEPHPVSTAAITAAATRVAVDGRGHRGSLENEDVMGRINAFGREGRVSGLHPAGRAKLSASPRTCVASL